MSVAYDFMKSKAIDFTDPNTKHDRVLVVGDKKFYVVSGVLIFWSDYFTSLLEGSFNESVKKEIELKEVDPKAFQQFLNILHDRNVRIEDDLLLPMIDLSHYFMAPRVLDVCKKEVNIRLTSTNIILLTKVLEKACEHIIADLKETVVGYFKNNNNVMKALNYDDVLECAEKHKLDDLKEAIGSYLENNDVMKTLRYTDVVDWANKYNMNDLKEWVGTYISASVTVNNFSDLLNYSADKDLPTLKAGIVNKIPTWNDPDVNDQQRYYSRAPVPKIPEESIIGLMESAFKHDIDVLKKLLRKRIFYMARGTHKYFYEQGAYDRRTVTANTFLEKNLQMISALPREINEYIITSSFSDI